MTDNDENRKDGLVSPSDQMSMSASMCEEMNTSQHEKTSPNNDHHKLSVTSSINGLDESAGQKQLTGTAKLESQPKEKLIQLIRKQLLVIKQERKTATDAKNEVETLRKQITDFESKQQQTGQESMLTLELTDYKKKVEVLRKKCDAADKELFDKDGLVKELSIKMHNLTETNAELTISVDRQKEEFNSKSAKIIELERSQQELQNELERQQHDAESRSDSMATEAEEMTETIKKLKKELKNIRNTGVDQKSELNQLQKAKEILQKNHDDLSAEFKTYKEKAEFVLKQHSNDKQRVNDSFEVEELQRQLKQKNEQINQYSERSVGYQQEINSAQERCRVLRNELEDARQSTQIAQKSVAEERRKISNEYEQRIRQLTKDLEDNKRDTASIQEHASNERQKLDEIHARVVAELNGQIQNLQFKLNQPTADSNANVQEVKQKTKEQKRSTIMNPINFDTETRFNVDELGKSNSVDHDKEDMLNSLHDLINGVDTSHNPLASQSSLNSWTDPDELNVQLQHTRAVLRETEETNSKLEAQVGLLKKELRRNEANNLGVQHINQNMAYFKSVMLKFLAPDEKLKDVRAQMLPALSTMLALSSEEVKSVESALKAQEEKGQSTSEIAGYFGPLSGIF